MKTIEVPIRGMDCMECTEHVQKAITSVPGVKSADVFLASEKAVILLDPDLVGLPQIRKAVAGAGYTVPEALDQAVSRSAAGYTRAVLTLFGVVFALVLFVVVIGEWLGLFEAVTGRIPWIVSAVVILALGYPVFLNVIRAALKRQVISHTLMTLGVVAAIAVGQWATAAVVVLFMRVGDYAERFTTERSRRAVKDLTRLAPQTARVEADGVEVEKTITEVQPGEIVIVRPGERIPVDGEVAAGQAAVDASSVTGESLPLEAGPGSHVYAASIVRQGSVKVRATAVGADTTFGKVIKLVEEAEAHRASVQRIADRFSAWYLPIVAGIGLLTLVFRHDPLAAAAVMVVACSCSFALATPIAMLASVGAGARRGLIIKGGKYLEVLDRADTALIDKTGTLTLGRPRLTDICPIPEAGRLVDENQLTPQQSDLLRLAASVERYSEHPLAEAVRSSAVEHGIRLLEPEGFHMIPGSGVRAKVGGLATSVGKFELEGGRSENLSVKEYEKLWLQLASALEAEGKSVLFVYCEGRPAGLLAAADTLRNEVPRAIASLRVLGFKHIELLTGDNPHSAEMLVHQIEAAGGGKIAYRAGLLPEGKIAIVRELQAQGRRVVMIGDGINDAPALAQADVGIAMGAAGTDAAIEAAHIALMREDWDLVPEAVRIARRTMNVVKMNIAFTAVYNLIGLSLAAFGFLPPILAAAAQSLPDLGILANSSRLLRK